MNSPSSFYFHNLFLYNCVFLSVKKIYQVFLKLERHYFDQVFLMAKNKSSKKGTSSKVPVRTDVSSVEAETIKRANHTISSIEKFLKKWESSKIKNKLVVPQVERIKKFHDELVKWEKKAAKHKGSEKDKLKRLHKFVIICRNYS